MPFVSKLQESRSLALYCLKWGFLGSWVGLLSGTASAGFLAALAWATQTRVQNPVMLFGLPVAGMFTGLLYDRFGKSVVAGNNLVLDTIHEPDAAIPFRMAPLIFLTTVVTHLFGGSAGREGTAVQMGGTLATASVTPLKLPRSDHRILIMAGVAGGFGSVFGTPIAGFIFGMEVLAVGRLEYDGLLPCLVASIVGDLVCRNLGIEHVHYSVGSIGPLTPSIVVGIVAAAVIFAIASTVFTESTHAIGKFAKQRIQSGWMRTGLGGVAVVVLALAFGRQYLGLSLPLISEAFHPQSEPVYVFALKILFTAVTLGFGFKGGEVTPLFCIGATLGSAYGGLIHQNPVFYAALGFVAVFAAAANTPLACLAMGIELFGSPLAVPLAMVCVVSYLLSGHRGIYLSQRVATPKGDAPIKGDLRKLSEGHRFKNTKE